MKFNIFFILFLLSNTITACDCGIPYLYKKYLYSDAIFHAKIGKNHSDKRLSRKYDIQILEVIKGVPIDTIFSGGNCGTAFKEGDEVILYLKIRKDKNIASTSMCYGNRRLKNNLFPKNNHATIERIGHLEIKALRFYHKYYNGFQQNSTPSFKYEKDYQSNILKKESFSIAIGVDKKIKVAHFEVLLQEDGKILEVNFLTKIPKDLKATILKNLQDGKWKMPDLKNAKNANFRVLQSILYPKKSKGTHGNFINKRDF